MAVDKRGRKLPKGIRQRGDRFEGRFMWSGLSYSVTGATVKEVQQKITDEKYRLEHGTILRRESVTLDEWYQTFMDDYKSGLKQTTKDLYNNVYRVRIAPKLGKLKVADIRPEHCQALLNATSKAYSKSGLEDVNNLLHNMLNQAVKVRLIPYSPMNSTICPKKEESERRPAMTREQQSIFTRHIENTPYADLIMFVLRTGLRVGELCGLRVSDIDFGKAVMHVTRNLQMTTAGPVEQTPKTKTGRRDIPLTRDALTIAIRQRDKYKGGPSDRPLFCHDDFSPYHSRVLSKVMNKIVGQIRESGHEDFPNVTMHVLRHTFATRAIEAGMNPQTLKAILGHASLSMTMDLYSHVMPDTKAAEMELLNNVF